jgi:Urease accessory protein UreE
MLKINVILLERGANASCVPERSPDARLPVEFDRRQRSRFLAQLDTGEEVAVALPRGHILRGGTLLEAQDGRVVEVVAAPEPVIKASASDAGLLLRAAYHLGNRHVKVELQENSVKLEPDPVLADMLEGLGLMVSAVTEPFEPEGGAYGHVHAGDVAHQHGSDGHHSHG